jgi:hypothetical protein
VLLAGQTRVREVASAFVLRDVREEYRTGDRERLQGWPADCESERL